MPEPAIPAPLSLAKTAGERIAFYQERANAWAMVRRDALRELVAAGWSLQKVADQLGVSKTRVATIIGDRDDDARLDRDLAELLASRVDSHNAPAGRTGSQRQATKGAGPHASAHTKNAIMSDKDRAELRRLLDLLNRLNNLADQAEDPEPAPAST